MKKKGWMNHSFHCENNLQVFQRNFAYQRITFKTHTKKDVFFLFCWFVRRSNWHMPRASLDLKTATFECFQNSWTKNDSGTRHACRGVDDILRVNYFATWQPEKKYIELNWNERALNTSPQQCHQLTCVTCMNNRLAMLEERWSRLIMSYPFMHAIQCCECWWKYHRDCLVWHSQHWLGDLPVSSLRSIFHFIFFCWLRIWCVFISMVLHFNFYLFSYFACILFLPCAVFRHNCQIRLS